MSYSLEFKPVAEAELKALTSTIQIRVAKKIKWLAQNFDSISPQALAADLGGFYKLRVGDYRVVYSFDAEGEHIVIHRIGHRRDVYD